LGDKQPEAEQPETKKTETKRAKRGDFKFLLRLLLYPGVKERVWRFAKKLFYRIYKLFTVKFENIEIRGSLGDPLYDSIAYGISGGCYYPWENENWSAKGEIVLKTGFFRWLFFLFILFWESLILAFILWRSSRSIPQAP